MGNKYFYKAFGLDIQSDFSIAQVQEVDDSQLDVRIVRSDLLSRYDVSTEYDIVTDEHILFRVDDIAVFRISSGNLIEAELLSGYSDHDIGVFLMGSCMGAILHQRGFMLLHGSCVTDGRRSILITGDSGAGKSTTAAEFLMNGWKLLTDDVTCIFERDGAVMVQSSYPSQKLWQDALDRYEKTSDDVHSLYFSEDREKFGVNVADSFFDGVCPLSMIVRLVPSDHPCIIGPIKGIAKVDQLMRNTYRAFMIAPKDRSRHFQRCVTLSTKIPMALAVRENGKQCADTIYELITKHLEENCHD